MNKRSDQFCRKASQDIGHCVAEKKKSWFVADLIEFLGLGFEMRNGGNFELDRFF